MGTEFLGRLDLILDLLLFETPSIKGVIPEGLQPWPETQGGNQCPLLGLFQCQVNDFVRVCDRDAISRDAVLKPGRVEHGSKVIDVRQNIIKSLSDQCVVQIPAHIAEDIRRKEGIV
jgi:hypothetical protein